MATKKSKPPPPKTAVAAKPKGANAAQGSGNGSPNFERWLAFGALLGALLVVMYIRVRLLDFPLERDEGEYAYFGQLLLNGIPPYQEAYNMKLPGASYFYALFMALFGQTPAGIHIGLLLTNVLCVLLLFFIGKKLASPTVAVVAAASYALLSLAPGSLGFAAHATHFNVLASLAGFAALLVFFEKGKLAWLIASGLGFGLSFVVKQHAAFLLLFGVFALFIHEKKRVDFTWVKTAWRAGVFVLAALAPLLMVFLMAAATGTFGNLWHWTVEYAGQYASIVSMEESIGLFRGTFEQLGKGMLWFWLLGAAGLVALFLRLKKTRHSGTLLLFSLFSVLCVLPGFYFRSHYFILFFPALALLVGVAFDTLRAETLRLNFPVLRQVPLLIFCLGWGFSVFSQRLFFFDGDPKMLCAMTYGTSNPFLESPEIAKFIASNTNETDCIAVLGSEPQIYFYSKRRSATGYIYMYPLVENQTYSAEMQREMIAEIERNQPKYLVYVDSPFSWLTHPSAPQDVFRWYQRYKSNFNLVGIIDMNPSRKATYVWRDQIAHYKGQGKNRVWVYERK